MILLLGAVVGSKLTYNCAKVPSAMDAITILLGALAGIATSIVTSYVTVRLSIRQERAKWERELVQKLAELTIDDAPKARRLVRQFAVGYFIFEQRGGEKEKVFIPPTGRLSVGRGPDNDVILQDIAISRHHAIFEVTDSIVFVVDLFATGGVFVNGERIRRKLELKNGDIVRIGKTHITFVALE